MQQTKIWVLVKAIFIKDKDKKEIINYNPDLELERYVLKVLGIMLLIVIFLAIGLSVFNIPNERTNEFKKVGSMLHNMFFMALSIHLLRASDAPYKENIAIYIIIMISGFSGLWLSSN